MESCLLVVRVVAAAVFLAFSAGASEDWNKKPYTEWSENQAVKLLNDSPWAQTHTFTDTSKAFNTALGRQPAKVIGTITFNFHL